MAKIKYYFDEMMPRPPAVQLVKLGYEVTMANDSGMTEKDDFDHLAFAAEHGQVLVTFDKPFAGKVMQRTDHAGLICLTGSSDDMGGIVRALSQFAERYEANDVIGQVFWLKQS